MNLCTTGAFLSVIPPHKAPPRPPGVAAEKRLGQRFWRQLEPVELLRRAAPVETIAKG